jgi:hypothetical protein
MTHELILKGKLNLMGDLILSGLDGGKVKVGNQKVGNQEVLVQADVGNITNEPEHGFSPTPVMLPPQQPIDKGQKVWVINSLNKKVKVKTAAAGNKLIVTQGMVIQGKTPTWPGMVLPSQGNTDRVTINSIPINVENDQAVIFASGATVVLSKSGQP